MNRFKSFGLNSSVKPLNYLDSAAFVYLLGFDACYYDNMQEDIFICYQGHHGDIGTFFAGLLLPSLWLVKNPLVL